MKAPTLDELRNRVEESIRFYGGSLPKESAAAWGGYFAALIEWGLISPNDHLRLIELLPRNLFSNSNADPVMQILLGWDELRTDAESEDRT